MKKLLWPVIVLILTCSFSPAQTAVQCLVGGVWVPCSMAPQPQFAQAPVPASTASGSSQAASYGSSTVKGNTLIVVFADGSTNNASTPVADAPLHLTWFRAAYVSNSTFESEIWYAPNTVGGGDTVTVSPGVGGVPIAMTIYEVPGLVYPAAASSPVGPQALDQTATNTGSSTSVSLSPPLTPSVANEYVFLGLGLGTGTPSIKVSPPYNADAAVSTGGPPLSLTEFVSASSFKPDMVATGNNPLATWTGSEPWGVAVASFKTLTVPVQGTVQGLGMAGAPSGGVVSVQGVSSGTAIPVQGVSGGAALSAQGLGTAGVPSGGVMSVQGVSGGTALSAQGLGTAGTPSGGVVSVQGVSSGTAIPVDILGSSGATLDAANNMLPPANVLAIGVQEQSSEANAMPGTSGNIQRPLADLVGSQFVRLGSSNPWSCVVAISSATTVQCEAAPSSGFRAYVTGIVVATTTAGTGSSIQVEYGTKTTNPCDTGTTALSAKFPNTTTTGQSVATWSDPVGGLVPAAANAICVVQSGGTGTSTVQLTGFIAP